MSFVTTLLPTTRAHVLRYWRIYLGGIIVGSLSTLAVITLAVVTPGSGVRAGRGRMAGSANAIAEEKSRAPRPSATLTPSPTPAPTPSGPGVSPLGGCTYNGTLAPCIGSATTGVSGWGKPVFDTEFSQLTALPPSWASTWHDGGNMNEVNTTAANVAFGGGYVQLSMSSSSMGSLIDTDPNQAPDHTGFQYGDNSYVEGKIYFPGYNSSENYNWPAFWSNGQNWPETGEIDIAEGLGTIWSDYWDGTGKGTSHNSGFIAGSWVNGWHTFAVDREPGKNIIYWDGQLIRTYPTDDGGAPQYLIINVGCWHDCVTGPAGAVKVAYVRVWKKQ